MTDRNKNQNKQAAYDAGVTAGFTHTAFNWSQCPEEYRDDDALKVAWIDGWEDGHSMKENQEG